MVNADDFTYSKGYLGLLSALGASLGITFCCAPIMPAVCRHCRRAYSQRKKMATLQGRREGGDLVLFSRRVPVDEENKGTNSSAPHETSSPTTDDNAAKTHGGSARFSVDGCDANSIPSPVRELRRNHTSSDVSEQVIPRCRALSIYSQSSRHSSSQMDGLEIQQEDSESMAPSFLAGMEAQRSRQGAQWSEPIIQRPEMVKSKLSR